MKFQTTLPINDINIHLPTRILGQWQTFVLFALKKTLYVTLTIETPKKPRSTGDGSQNHHLNGHIRQICEETGNEPDVVKLEVKYRAVVFLGYPTEKRPDGSDALDIWGRPKGISESDSSIEECSQLIEMVHVLASELGIILRED
jgi:hypothetical protein